MDKFKVYVHSFFWGEDYYEFNTIAADPLFLKFWHLQCIRLIFLLTLILLLGLYIFIYVRQVFIYISTLMIVFTTITFYFLFREAGKQRCY